MKNTAIETLKITSRAFGNNEYIPKIYTCEGRNINPPFSIENIPSSTKTLAIIVDDPDATKGGFTHWITWNIPMQFFIEENALTGGIEGLNDYETHKYMGLCPPSGVHKYFFKVYALDVKLDININSKKSDLEKAMEGHVIAYGELIGLYKKTKVE
jgi:Raf kinase inhibitor-like YbhB/YbcL family protein